MVLPGTRGGRPAKPGAWRESEKGLMALFFCAVFCEDEFGAGEEEGAEAVGIVCFAGAGVVEADILFDVGADTDVGELAVGGDLAGETIPAVECDGEVVRADPAFVDGVGDGVNEHGGDGGLEV